MNNSKSVPGRQSVFIWLRRIAFTTAGLIVLLAILGVSYQAVETLEDARRFPPRGKLVDVGGFKLNLNCTGRGSPTVILESGLGVLAIEWQLVQPEIAKFTRVCSYDRAGYGWSDAGPMPRTSEQIANELHTLMQNAGEKQPYVLVGHSAGGLDVRVYNGQFPNDVVGMVLVDATEEDQLNIMPPNMRKVSDEEVKKFNRNTNFKILLIRFGLSRITSNRRDEETVLDLQPKFIESMKSELNSFEENGREVRAAGTLANKPLIVLTAGKERVPSQYSKRDFDEYYKIWVDDLQMREARLSSRGERIIVPDSGHMIPLERPDSVVNAVRKICEAVNSD